MVLVTDRKQLR